MVRKRAEGGHGTKAAILLVHGFGQNRYTWHTSQRSFVNYLARAGFDVFNLDLRGRGRSRRFGAAHVTSVDDYIREDVPAAVRTVVRVSGHEKVFLIGHSMGGLVIYGAAGSTASDETAGVVTIGSPYRFGLGSLFLKFAAPALYGARLSGVFDGNPRVPFRLLGSALRKWRRFLDLPYVPVPLRPWLPRSMEPDILDETLAKGFEHSRFGIALDIVRCGREAAMQSRDGLVDYGLAFELSNVPLLVIAGTLDSLAPPASVRPVLERCRSDDKSYREFPAGHLDLVLGHDAPYTVWPLIRTWVEGRAPQTAPSTSKASVPGSGLRAAPRLDAADQTRLLQQARAVADEFVQQA